MYEALKAKNLEGLNLIDKWIEISNYINLGWTISHFLDFFIFRNKVPEINFETNRILIKYLDKIKDT